MSRLCRAQWSGTLTHLIADNSSWNELVLIASTAEHTGSHSVSLFWHEKKIPSGGILQVADQLTYSIYTGQGAFSVSDTGVLAYIKGGNMRQLVWFNRAGQELGPVGAPDAYGRPSLSPDGKSVALTNSNPSIGARNIWRLDISRGLASRFTFDGEWDVAPIWSPDGGRIAFTSSRNGTWDLYQKAASGTSQEEVLLKSNERKSPTHWSWDGRFIAYTNMTANGDYDVWVLPLFGRSAADSLRTNEVCGTGAVFFSQRTMAGLRFKRVWERRGVCSALSAWCWKFAGFSGWRNSTEMVSRRQRVVLSGP